MEQLLRDVGFVVERISGELYSEDFLPVVGLADYDMNVLFHCSK